MMKYFVAIVFWFSLVSFAFGEATIPSTDKKGAKDNPLLKRDEGSIGMNYVFPIPAECFFLGDASVFKPTLVEEFCEPSALADQARVGIVCRIFRIWSE